MNGRVVYPIMIGRIRMMVVDGPDGYDQVEKQETSDAVEMGRKGSTASDVGRSNTVEVTPYGPLDAATKIKLKNFNSLSRSAPTSTPDLMAGASSFPSRAQSDSHDRPPIMQVDSNSIDPSPSPPGRSTILMEGDETTEIHYDEGMPSRMDSTMTPGADSGIPRNLPRTQIVMKRRSQSQPNLSNRPLPPQKMRYQKSAKKVGFAASDLVASGSMMDLSVSQQPKSAHGVEAKRRAESVADPQQQYRQMVHSNAQPNSVPQLHVTMNSNVSMHRPQRRDPSGAAAQFAPNQNGLYSPNQNQNGPYSPPSTAQQHHSHGHSQQHHHHGHGQQRHHEQVYTHSQSMTDLHANANGNGVGHGGGGNVMSPAAGPPPPHSHFSVKALPPMPYSKPLPSVSPLAMSHSNPVHSRPNPVHSKPPVHFSSARSLPRGSYMKPLPPPAAAKQKEAEVDHVGFVPPSPHQDAHRIKEYHDKRRQQEQDRKQRQRSQRTLNESKGFMD